MGSLPEASWLVCGQEARLQELTPSLGSNGFRSTAGRAQPQLRLTGPTGWAGLAPPINLTQVRSPARETPAGKWHLLSLQSFRNLLILWLFIFVTWVGDSVSNKKEALQAQ